MDLIKLKEDFSACSLCPHLLKSRSKIVFGSKHMNKCKVMIIGEAPGKKEDELGEPFVGKSGEILNMFLSEIGLNRDDVFITNTVLCRPEGNRNPKPEELKNCEKRLNKTIEIMNPKVIVSLGNFSTKYLLNSKEGITNLRGKIQNRDGKIILPMFHPATLLYNGMSEKLFKEFRTDFAILKSLL
jgi:DNA polymerase